MIQKVAAVVVTFNRKDLLCECLRAIAEQEFQPFVVYVIDNASTDGTEALFDGMTSFGIERLRYVRLPENRGGAGGFKAGIELAAKEESEWLWIMDDDTIPRPSCLKELVLGAESMEDLKPSYFASLVRGPAGEPMNVPSVSVHLGDNGYPDWYLNCDEGLVRIGTATFVSLLIAADAVRQVGLPIENFFLWGDDTEYTSRLTRFYGPAFLCAKSEVLHLRKNAAPIDIATELDAARIPRYAGFYRNNLVVEGYYKGRRFALRLALRGVRQALGLIASRQTLAVKKATAIVRGIADYYIKPQDLEDLGALDRSSMGPRE